MDYGICLPNFPDGSSREGIEAAADVATRLGWSTAWTNDHVLVDHASADEYGRIYEAIMTLAWVGARYPKLKLGTSVIVVPPRDAVTLAKEIATLDALTGGRVIAGTGVGWNEPEFANMGHGGRYRVRGAYLDEAIRLWRHLWSGSQEPFHGGSTHSTTSCSGPCRRRARTCRSTSAAGRRRRSGGLAGWPTATTRARRTRPAMGRACRSSGGRPTRPAGRCPR